MMALVQLVAQRIGSATDRRERLHFAAVKLGPEGGTAIVELGKAVGRDLLELRGLFGKGCQRLVHLGPQRGDLASAGFAELVEPDEARHQLVELVLGHTSDRKSVV